MCKPGSVAASLLMLASATALAQTPDLHLSGYYKNLLVQSRTWADERYTLDLNRLRVAVQGKVTDQVSVDLQYDNEILLGNFLRTTQFNLQKDTPSPQLWDLEANWRDTPGLYGRHRLYRAFATAALGDMDVRLGRQRIAWGTGRFWSPLDLLNPINPVSIEREERLGTDAALVEYKFGPLTRASLVYAPGRRFEPDTRAARWHANAAGIDYSLVFAQAAGTRVLGGDLAGQLGQAGWRAELAQFNPAAGSRYARALVGVDYAFRNSLTVTGELYFNGAGESNPARYDFASLMAGRIQSLGRRYAAGRAGYEITPLLKCEFDLAVNLADRSKYLGVALVYSAAENLELRAGIQRFTGARGSEFERFPNTGYLQLQRFF